MEGGTEDLSTVYGVRRPPTVLRSAGDSLGDTYLRLDTVQCDNEENMNVGFGPSHVIDSALG